MKPVIIINCKAYREGIGVELERLVMRLSKVDCSRARVILCVQEGDIFRLREGPFDVYAQHVDPIDFGAHTGHVHPDVLKEAGAKGSLLNHAEHQLTDKEICTAMDIAHSYGLEICLSADTPERAASLAHHSPEFIALEPPELIGGKVSISKARPDLVTAAIREVRSRRQDQKVLVGAGVKDGEDFRLALELGADGILLASGIVLHESPGDVLADLLSVL